MALVDLGPRPLAPEEREKVQQQIDRMREEELSAWLRADDVE